ncbi:hypothetical protein [Pontibacter litorisediminis]|uniref:hypothetical protein n=1 Tax=Pontibacter litorisediminis TaxID=1846260 RepID=UPI0023EBBB32|nr:hypothetical protein [Pontibacter litorisediminis]
MEFYIREIYPWVIEISSISFSIPLIAAIWLIGKRSSLLFRLLLLYTIFLALIEITGQLTVYLGTQNNHWIQHIYTPLEYVLLAMVYYGSLNNRYVKVGVLLSIVGVGVFSVLTVALGQDMSRMNALPRMVAGALLVTMAVLYLYQAAHALRFTYLDRDPMFVLSSGIIIYQAGTAMAFSMFNTALQESYDAARICLTIIVVLNIFFRVILMMAIRRSPVK